jgi:hypothetical protein
MTNRKKRNQKEIIKNLIFQNHFTIYFNLTLSSNQKHLRKKDNYQDRRRQMLVVIRI